SGRMHVTSYGLFCYQCTDDPQTDDFNPYDADCGKYDYSGSHTQEVIAYTCTIRIWNNGAITRSNYNFSTYHGGDCLDDEIDHLYTECFFEGNLSNTNSVFVNSVDILNQPLVTQLQ
ncbi:unnamed protein product, partial [Meganyctiphanes norvegica]